MAQPKMKWRAVCSSSQQTHLAESLSPQRRAGL